MSSSVKDLQSLSHLNEFTSQDNNLTVIDFHATWCGPCRVIAPTYARLATENPDVNFLKCDVDDARDVAAEYGITAMPTFIFLKGGEKVDQVRGANKSALEAAVARHKSSN